MSTASIAHSSTREQECGRMLPLGVCRPRLGCIFVVTDPPEAHSDAPRENTRGVVVGSVEGEEERRGLPAAPRGKGTCFA